MAKIRANIKKFTIAGGKLNGRVRMLTGYNPVPLAFQPLSIMLVPMADDDMAEDIVALVDPTPDPSIPPKNRMVELLKTVSSAEPHETNANGVVKFTDVPFTAWNSAVTHFMVVVRCFAEPRKSWYRMFKI